MYERQAHCYVPFDRLPSRLTLFPIPDIACMSSVPRHERERFDCSSDFSRTCSSARGEGYLILYSGTPYTLDLAYSRRTDALHGNPRVEAVCLGPRRRGHLTRWPRMHHMISTEILASTYLIVSSHQEIEDDANLHKLLTWKIKNSILVMDTFSTSAVLNMRNFPASQQGHTCMQ